jgi:hypothetical protein
MIKKLLLASLLAGSASLAAAQEPVEIRLWHMEQPPHRVERVQELIDEFNAANPGIAVTQSRRAGARSMPRRRPRSPPATRRTSCSPFPTSRR